MGFDGVGQSRNSASTARSCPAPAAMESARIRSVGACMSSPAQQPRATAGTPAAVPPRVPARAGHREPHPHRADGVREHAVLTVAFQRQHRLGPELAAGVAGAAQPAETFLADGEDDGQRRFCRARERALGHGHGGRDRDRVVADPRAAQPAVAPCDAPRRRLAEDVIDVNEDSEPVRRRAERPHQVAGLVDVPAPGFPARRRCSQSMRTCSWPVPPGSSASATASAAIASASKVSASKAPVSEAVSRMSPWPDKTHIITPPGPAYHLIRPLV